MLEDVQSRRDHRRLPIDEVGISGIRYPVIVLDREHGKQNTIADVTMSVELGPEHKGTHLSRFVELLRDTAAEVTPATVLGMLVTLRHRLATRRASLEFRFPYFLQRSAPVTGSSAMLDYQCWLSGSQDDDETRLVLGVRVPVTSACPCSKAISDYGAHNQRSHIIIHASLELGQDGLRAPIWADDLIGIAETAASCPVYSLLKRPDERYVTMRAYDNPVFVEDMVRAAAESLARQDQIGAFSVEATSDESIHNHSAFARIVSRRHGGLAWQNSLQ